jgi:predicted RNase H-like HicB family nuclease
LSEAIRADKLIVMIVPLSKVRLRRDEDGVWIAKSSLLPGCHAHGRDRGEATLRFQQAAKAHLEALLTAGRPIPRRLPKSR